MLLFLLLFVSFGQFIKQAVSQALVVAIVFVLRVESEGIAIAADSSLEGGGVARGERLFE